MRIIIPMLGFGKAGGHRVLSCLASEWVKKGHDVLFVCPKNYHDIYYPTSAKIHYTKSAYQLLPDLLKNRVTRDLFGLLSLLLYLLRNTMKGDILLANRDLTAYVVWLTTKAVSAIGYYYIQAYEPEFYSWPNKMLTLFTRYVSAKTYRLDLIRIVNSSIYCSYKEISTNIVIPPGYDQYVFFPRPFRKLHSESITIGCIGRKQKWKGTAELIEAVTKVARQDKRIRLKVAFEIPTEISLPTFAEQVYPHGDYVLADFYRTCDIFITTGKIQHGAFHYPCLEALACGVPLITSRYYPANTTNSIILDDQSVESIVSGILKLLNLNEIDLLEMRSKGLDCAAEMNWEACSFKFIKIFESHKLKNQPLPTND